MNSNNTLFVYQANNAGGSSATLSGAVTSTKSSAAATPSKNPAYVKHSKHLRELNLKRGEWWGSGLMGFWALLVLVSSIEHLGSRFFPNASMHCKRAMARNPIARLWRKYVTMPALFNQKHTSRVMLGGAIPTRFESLVLFAYFALIVIGESVNYNYYKENTFWKEKKKQISRYVGDRSGKITMFMINTVYLFAGRNNFLLWLTGWKMSTFYVFHKWIGRMTIVSSFVHTITMLINSYWIKKIHTRKLTSWWRWGSVAMVCGGIILLQSLPLIRHRFYEIFLYGHIVLAVFFLIGVWIHVEPFGDGPFAYSVAAIWCFDRFVRILKMSQFGLRLAHIKSVGDDCLVMTVPAKAIIKKPTPGSFGYVYFLEGWTFFQSHPFTVIHEDNGNIKFLIRVKSGVTKQVYNHLLKHPEQEVTTRVAIEGYYGEYKTAYAYDEVIMVGGGNGVVGLYEYVKDIANRKKAGRSNVKFVKFYWTIKFWDNIKWLAPELMKLQEFDFVKPIVYVTRPESSKKNVHGFGVAEDNRVSSSDGSQNELEIEDSEVKSPNDVSKAETKVKENIVGITNIDEIESEFSHVEFRTSRPHVPQLLHDDIQNCDPSDNICVLSCAHNAMCDDVRKTVSFEVGEPRSGRIDLVELLQIW
ncbi:hypothetical protein ZYGR_0AS03890 [Zygosaccharomyces rouxii]|uniref:FAD-binding FR-type domain-containing protein n=1 Tax=Zygosaccharomyces rouxii TaxID=4956 RepID=A0A1Q3AH38_ZYGRO|nr:hypothetical protein ZYGR_0AS03890 [Zygosaccharomyces rouxii]